MSSEHEAGMAVPVITRLVLTGAGDPLLPALAEALTSELAAAGEAPTPAGTATALPGPGIALAEAPAGRWRIEVVTVGEKGSAAGDALAETGLGASVLILLPRRDTPRGLDAAGLAPSDRALLAAAHRWSATPPATGPERRLVLVSSGLVHEPSHRQPGFVTEDRLPRRPPANRVALRWRALEAAFEDLAGAVPRSAIVRPTPVPVRGGSDPFSRLLAGRFALTPAGYNPPLQLLTVTELARAVAAVVDGSLGAGPWHVAPDGVAPLRKALRQAGVHRLPLPTTLLKLIRRLAGGEPDEVEALRYPVTVSDAALRHALGRHALNHRLVARPRELTPPTLERPAAELAHDPFGLDRAYVARLGRTLFRFLHDVWWRIEWRGLEHVPRQGGAVLVGNHRGHQPWDGVMVLHRLASDLGRHARFLMHPTLAKFPFLAPYMTGCGGLHACRENGDWVLSQQELLAVFPEGIRGAFSLYRDAHRLLRFRPDYVRFALRHQVPIVPFVVVGSAEIFPILAKIEWRWWKRVSEWPTLPLTPTLSLLPLPSKWHVQVLEPLDVTRGYGPEAADDPTVVDAVNREVHRRMAKTLAAMLSRRRHLFYGSIFDGVPAPERSGGEG